MYMNFCKYKSIFLDPSEGPHAFRIFGLAAVDTILTVLFGLWYSYKFNTNFWKTIIILFILGIILHRLFCVNTTIGKMIFGEIN